MAKQKILAGDIGGTKTKLAIFTDDLCANPTRKMQYTSASYTSLAVMVQDFLEGFDERLDAACFGIAGPVLNGRSQTTNLPWLIEADKLETQLGIQKVCLINDLEATGLGIVRLGNKDILTLAEGQAQEHGTMAVIAPGTGLGEGFLTWNQDRYLPQASEGGHSDFAPADEQQAGLWRYLAGKYGHVSWERVCSGLGFPDIYRYLQTTGMAPATKRISEEIDTASDPTPIIMKYAMDEGNCCPLCEAALNLYLAALGAEAGNLALKTLATGGIYVAGGIPPRIVEPLASGIFMKAFLAKGRMSSLMAQIPVRVVLNPEAALLGAAHHAFTIISEDQ